MNVLTQMFPWNRYSRKLIKRIKTPCNAGHFDSNESSEREMRLVAGKEGSIEDGNCVELYWLVDEEDGVIVDAKFQTFGQSALIAAADIACDLLVGKNYGQAMRLSADLIDRQVRDKTNTPSFPQETYPHINLVIGAIDNAAEQCLDIPLKESYDAPPTPMGPIEVREGGYPGWIELQTAQKIDLIKEVIEIDIAPYIALDGGGVEVINLIENEIIIRYKGNCTSCFASVGTTLSYIQETLKAKLHPDLKVTPDLNL
ncbi:MAG: iron-sulfur cluster assembly scaffold protein [Waddliaceae bacterium]